MSRGVSSASWLLFITSKGLWERHQSAHHYEISAIILSFMDPLAHTNGTTNGDASVESPAAFDPLIFRKYLLSLLPPVIGADPADLDTLFVDEFDERAGRFATEAGGVIYIVKIKNEAEGERVVL